jgi:hypothetical protein
VSRVRDEVENRSNVLGVGRDEFEKEREEREITAVADVD